MIPYTRGKCTLPLDRKWQKRYFIILHRIYYQAKIANHKGRESMTSSSLLYCNNCGAANQKQATHCFACEESLHTTSKETLLKQRYRIIGLVGQGGFGAVYKAVDTQSGNRLVAIKAINLSILTAQEVIEATGAFNREVLVLSGLTHPNLPRLNDHFTDTEHWYHVTDFIEGETLERYLDKTRHGRLPTEEVIDIGIQLCTVLDYLHTRQPPN